MAKMNTARSHVLNCELYKDLAMKVDELRSIVVGTEDIEALRLENQTLRSELEISEDARVRAIYDITKSGTIQRVCVQAQRKVESQLRASQNMVHAKYKELTEAWKSYRRPRICWPILESLIICDFRNLSF
ncbi:hypothetical protein Fot_06272 [Forsythia ovata]|uniref:Uncharacterized protein n=1 Tax=Forsythia ovata TaxID=205694 RepID=A0ABD1WVE4_9LAMI